MYLYKQITAVLLQACKNTNIEEINQILIKKLKYSKTWPVLSIGRVHNITCNLGVNEVIK